MLRNTVLAYFLSLTIIFLSCAEKPTSIEKTSAIGSPDMVGNLSPGMVNSLLDDGVPVAVKKNAESALLSAAAKGDIDTMKSLLAEGVDVNERNKKGKTALMLAAFNNRIEAVKFLLEKGADVNAKDEDGHTTLFFAVKRGKTTIVELLKQTDAKE
jgi:ankyrin repeat protein